jgi:glucan 1,3-beta-glucosidase
MRVLSFIPAALALAPAAVSAAGTLGFSLGDKNPDGTCKSTSDYEADFDALKPYTTLVRNYAANDCDTAKNIIPAAKKKGFKVVMGVWYLHRRPLETGSWEWMDADTPLL